MSNFDDYEGPKDLDSGYDSNSTGSYILRLQERCKALEGKQDEDSKKIEDLKKRVQQLEQKIANKLPF